MKRIIDDLGAAFQFMQTGLRQIDKNASIVPSSAYLVDAMVDAIPMEGMRCLVEFGPGTGVITKAILKAMPADAHLHAIELDADLLKLTTERMNDPRLRPLHGSAADAVSLIRTGACSHGASAVFSSLGLALMNDSLRESILAAARDVLTSDGRFVQYQYLHGRALTYQFGQGFAKGFNGKKYLRHHFREVTSRVVMVNFPPAAVYSCHGPLKVIKAAPAKHDTGRARRRKQAAGGRRR